MTRPDHAPQQELEAPSDRFDLLSEALLLALLIFAPLALGVVQAWSEQIVVTLAAAMLVSQGFKFLLRGDAKPVLSWAYLPLALFLLLAAFQLIPLPENLLRLLSSNTAEIKGELLSDLPGAADGGPRRMTTTFYPGGTMHQLRLALAVAAVFLTAAQIYCRPAPVRRLLGVISVLGAAIAVLAIAQIVTGAEKIYWLVSISTDDANGGTFVNRNNFCQFMNLALGASLGLLLLKINDGLKGVKKTLPNVLDWVTSSSARWVWLLVGTIVAGMVSVLISLSRGGVISLLLAGTLVTVFMTIRRRMDGRAWVMAGMVLCAFVCVLIFGFDAVFDRLATLEEKHAYLGRFGIAQGVLLAWTKFPLLGAGFGTHEVVYPMFDRTTMPTLSEYAENEYAQTAEETGVIGLLLVAAFVVIVWINCRRCVRGGGWTTAVGFGMSFALLAVLVHSVGDFGLHLPANGCLAAAYCGLLTALGNRARNRLNSSRIRAGRSRILAPAGLVLMILVMGWAVYGANQARAAEDRWKQAQGVEEWLVESNWQGRNETFAELISHAAAAVELDPGNIEYRHQLGVYRWRSISRVVDPVTGQIKLSVDGVEHVRRIVKELLEAAVSCPTYGPIYADAGQLEWHFLDQASGSKHVQRGFELAPHNASVCYIAGLLDAHEGRLDDALAKLERALLLDRNLFGGIVDVLIKEDVAKPDLALKLAEDDSGRLTLLAEKLAGSDAYRGRAQEVRLLAITLLKAQCRAPDASADLLARVARLYVQEDDFEAAAECYVRALEADYGQVAWRLNLARVYVAMGRTEDALYQARLCLRLRPQMDAATKIIEDLGDVDDS